MYGQPVDWSVGRMYIHMVCVGSSALIGRAAAALVTPHRLPAATAQVGSAAPLVYSTANSRQPTTASIKQVSKQPTMCYEAF